MLSIKKRKKATLPVNLTPRMDTFMKMREDYSCFSTRYLHFERSRCTIYLLSQLCAILSSA